MARGHASKPTLDSSKIEAALAALDAEEPRCPVRDIMPWLDESSHARLVNALVEGAARSRSGWVPAGPTDQLEYYLEDFEDLRLGLQRLQDPADPILDWTDVRGRDPQNENICSTGG